MYLDIYFANEKVLWRFLICPADGFRRLSLVTLRPVGQVVQDGKGKRPRDAGVEKLRDADGAYKSKLCLA